MTGKLEWRCHTPNLLSEIMCNPGTGALRVPMKEFKLMLFAVAERAAEINDPKLNRMMLQLTLYDIADANKHPEQKEYHAAMAAMESAIAGDKT
jgi:hypothetical protein